MMFLCSMNKRRHHIHGARRIGCIAVRADLPGKLFRYRGPPDDDFEPARRMPEVFPRFPSSCGMVVVSSADRPTSWGWCSSTP